MKKLIIIAIITLSTNLIFAQNQNTQKLSKERQEWGAFIDAELAKIAPSQQSGATNNQSVEVTKTTSTERSVNQKFEDPNYVPAPKPVAVKTTESKLPTTNSIGTTSQSPRPLTAEDIRIQKTLQSGTPGRR